MERKRHSMWSLYKMGGITPAISSVFHAQNAQHMAFIRSIQKDLRNQSLYDISLKTLETVVFDLETSGFSPYNGDEIISIGAVLVRYDEVIEDHTFYSLTRPKRRISEEIENLTKLNNDDLAKAPFLIEVLGDFFRFTGQRVLVAHGTGHDKHFLNSAMWQTSRTNLTHRMLDTMMLARWLHPEMKSLSLDYLLDVYEIELTTRHHALHDAMMTAKLLSKFMSEIEARGITTLGDLYTQLSHLP